MLDSPKSVVKPDKKQEVIASNADFQAYLHRLTLGAKRETRRRHKAEMLEDKLVHETRAKLYRSHLRKAITLVFVIEDILSGDSKDKPAEIRNLLTENELPLL